MIEMTLNENNMLDVLGQNGSVTSPSQLLPLLVGVLSFARVLWLIYVQWKEKRDKAAKQLSNTESLTDDNGVITPTPRSFRGYKALLPWVHSADSEPVEDVEEPDSPRRAHSRFIRYLVAVFPWLSTFDFWTKPKKSVGDVEESSPASPPEGEKNNGLAVHDSMVKKHD
jgi:hypothetical protein